MIAQLKSERKTKSEKLFERFCTENDIPFSRIPRSKEQGRKSPDYMIVMGKQNVAVEIKQFDANSDNKKQLGENGITGVFEDKMIARVRSKIKKAVPQLKMQSEKNIPALIMLYNNIPASPKYVHPDDILQAMYGNEQATLIFHVPSDAPYIGRLYNGGGRQVSLKDNTSLSAIVSLFEDFERNELHANFYHNIYGAIRFEPNWLRRQNVKHFIPVRSENEFWVWKEA